MSSEVTMTLYEALEKKKIYDKRLEKLNSHRLATIRRQGADSDTAGRSIKDMIDPSIKSSFDQTLAIIINSGILNSAINDANARIQVEIAGESYSIASAISRYRNIDVEERYYKAILDDLNGLKNEVEITNKKNLSPDAVTSYVKAAIGDSFTDPAMAETIETIKNKYREDTTVEIYDPLGLTDPNSKNFIEKLLDNVVSFKASFHTALTAANISNVITVDLA